MSRQTGVLPFVVRQRALSLLGLVPILACTPSWRGFSQAAEPAITYSAPQGEKASRDYKVEVGGKAVFVYTAPVLHGGPVSFAYFDMSAPVTVTVTAAQRFGAIKVRPASCGINRLWWATPSPLRSPNLLT